MKKYILIIIIFIFTVISCEKDDFCNNNTKTPKLVIRFMSYTKTDTLKKPDTLNVWVKGKDSIYKQSLVDSITLPLNSLTSETIYNFSVAKDSISSLNIRYKTEDEFVSRSCGFKVNYTNLHFTLNNIVNSWIDSISINKLPTLKNQTNAHITIFH